MGGAGNWRGAADPGWQKGLDCCARSHRGARTERAGRGAFAPDNGCRSGGSACVAGGRTA